MCYYLSVLRSGLGKDIGLVLKVYLDKKIKPMLTISRKQEPT